MLAMLRNGCTCGNAEFHLHILALFVTPHCRELLLVIFGRHVRRRKIKRSSRNGLQECVLLFSNHCWKMKNNCWSTPGCSIVKVEQRHEERREAVETADHENNSSIITIDEKCPKRMTHSRDPHRKNAFVKISFIDVFSEVDDLQTYDGIWYLSNKVYKSAKRKCYLLITIFLSVPTALVCGVQLAVVTFLRVWCCLPCLKTLDIQMQCMHLLLHSFFRAFAVPFFESVGRCFYFLRARIYKTESRK